MVDLDQLLERTSRTFALNIPLLPEPTRREVTVAYLLFRIADTFEDSVLWPRERRIRALADFQGLLADPATPDRTSLVVEWIREPPLRHEGYVQLLGETPLVLDAFSRLAAEARESIRHHVGRTAEGMSGFVARSDADGHLRLKGLQELRDYCYVVAGIVGEMLTVLFLCGREHLGEVAPRLRDWAPVFGEGLQLTNILKDVTTDLDEGRRYLPEGVDRAEVFDLAHRDLDAATEYTLALQDAGAERGLVAFNALPVALARATLDRLEARGPGSKLSRPELWSIVSSVRKALDKGRPPLQRRAPDPVA
ncbi:MAG TPA: squalene/phytoene synthase family protein [Longimicrobiales bacterium]|jgi:farnesyl-diphosphate farnesyltransferase